jgi:DedD protein
MNEAAFREVERSSGGSSEATSERDFGLGLGQNQWRDKIEVRLDNRQVFFLFFGSALCACMLFVLGVIVGKRLESRGRAAIPEVQDPLAVLDRMNGGAAAPGSTPANAKAEPSLTFPKALISPPARPRSAPVAAGRPAAAPAPALPAAAAKPPVAPKMAPPVAPRPTPAPAPSKVTAIPNGKLASTVAAKLPLPAATTVAVVPPAPATPATPPAAGKGKYSLVLSSFPERAEAEALAKRFASQGAYVAVAESPGKATVYRVRVGNYASTQEAAAAKTAFEKQTNTIAYVAGR